MMLVPTMLPLLVADLDMSDSESDLETNAEDIYLFHKQAWMSLEERDMTNVSLPVWPPKVATPLHQVVAVTRNCPPPSRWNLLTQLHVPSSYQRRVIRIQLGWLGHVHL